MDNLTAKKKQELFYLNRFKELFNEFPDIEPKASEEPDFTIPMKEYTLGIEITRLFRSGEPEQPIIQEQEKLHQYLTNKAFGLYEKTGCPPTAVSIHFKSRSKIQKNQIDTLSKQIVDIVKENIPPENNYNVVKRNKNNKDYYPEEIHTIGIHRFSSLTKSFWSVPDSWWEFELSIEKLKSVIDSKSCCCTEYLKKCDKIWLLIIADGYRQSSSVDFAENITNHIFKSNFLRIFILHNMEKLIELKTTHN